MHDMQRTELQQEVVQALIESKAVDFEAAGSVLSKYGARAALEGSGLVFKVDKRFIPDLCIPVDFERPGRFGLEAEQG
jgi:hypothetical protein